jgi:hypothetical protein
MHLDGNRMELALVPSAASIAHAGDRAACPNLRKGSAESHSLPRFEQAGSPVGRSAIHHESR